MVNTDSPATSILPLRRDNVVPSPNASTFPGHPPDSTVPGPRSLPLLVPLNPRAASLDMPAALASSSAVPAPASDFSAAAAIASSSTNAQPPVPVGQASAPQHHQSAPESSSAPHLSMRQHDPLPLVSPDHSPMQSDDDLEPPSPKSRSVPNTNGKLSKSISSPKVGQKRRTNSASTDLNAPDQSATPPTKKRRGRPPKNKAQEAQAPIASQTNQTKATKKKRGDPPPGAEHGWGTRLIKLDIDASNIISEGRPKRQPAQLTEPTTNPTKRGQPKRGAKRAVASRVLTRRSTRVASVTPKGSTARRGLRVAAKSQTTRRPQRAPRASLRREVVIDHLLLDLVENLDNEDSREFQNELRLSTEKQPSAPEPSKSTAAGVEQPQVTSTPNASLSQSVGGIAPVAGAGASFHQAPMIPMAPPQVVAGFAQAAPSPDQELLAALYSILKVFAHNFVGEPRAHLPPPPIIPGMAPVVMPPPPIILEEELANFLLRAQVVCANHKNHLLPTDYDRLRVLVIKNRLDGPALRWYLAQWPLKDPSYAELEQALELVWGNTRWRRHSTPPIQQLGDIGEYILRFELDRVMWPKGPTLQTAQHFAYGLQEPLRGMILERLRQNPNVSMIEVYNWTRFG